MNVKINLSFIDRYHAFVILSNFSLIFELKCTSLILGTYAIENAVIQNTRRSMRTYQYVKNIYLAPMQPSNFLHNSERFEPR